MHKLARSLGGLLAREGWERFSGKPHKLPKQVQVLPPQPVFLCLFRVASFSAENALPLRACARPRYPENTKEYDVAPGGA
jgi:hypothetical protein